MILNKPQNKADLIGVFNSSICVAHCLATPILIGFGANYLESPFFSYAFIAIALFSIYKATKNCSNKKIIGYLWLSFFGFAASLILEDVWFGFEYIGYAFSALIIIAHILNIRHCKKCI